MKHILIFFTGLGCLSAAHGQSLRSINSGAVSANNLIYTVGEIFVVPSNQNEASSGLVGAISRIEFLSLGIADITPIPQLRFYPNPTAASVFVEVDKETINQFYIYDVSGKLIDSLKNTNNQIDLSGLQPGTYFIKTDNQHLESFKIIKR